MSKELEDRISYLETKIEMIEQRNKKVEQDKAWETSFIRKLIIAILTYLTVSIVMMSFGIQSPWVNAVIPTLGFLLSTSSLNIFKNIWLTRQNNSRRITE